MYINTTYNIKLEVPNKPHMKKTMSKGVHLIIECWQTHATGVNIVTGDSVN